MAVAKKQQIHTVGRRKSAVARVFLRPGNGAVSVNERTLEDYFGRATFRMIINQPLALTGLGEKFDLLITVKGGGLAAQAGAVRHGISRALLKVGDDNRPVLKKAGLLTRDAREVERKKYGKHKARKSTQYSKR